MFLTLIILKLFQNELSRYRREYRKALQMIKDCFKKMQQQEKEIKNLKNVCCTL